MIQISIPYFKRLCAFLIFTLGITSISNGQDSRLNTKQKVEERKGEFGQWGKNKQKNIRSGLTNKTKSFVAPISSTMNSLNLLKNNKDSTLQTSPKISVDSSRKMILNSLKQMKGDVNGQIPDSIIGLREYRQQRTSKKDSNEVHSKIISSDSLATRAKSTISNKLNSHSINSSTKDSLDKKYRSKIPNSDSVRHQVKEKFGNLLALPKLNSEQTSNWDQVKEYSNLNGTIELQSFATNYLDPFTPGEKNYTRIFANPSFDLLGIPLTSNVYLSTEKSTYYNANSVTFSLDFQRFRQLGRQKIQAKIKDQVDIQKINKIKSLDLADQSKQIKRKIASQENQVVQYKSFIKIKANQLLAEYESKVNDYEACQRMQISQSKNKLKDVDMHAIDYEHYKDSLVAAQMIEINSLLDLYSQYQNSIKQLTDLKSKLKQLEEVRAKIKASDDLATENIKHCRKQYSSSDQLVGFGKKKLGTNPLLHKILNNSEQLDVGITYPYLSENTLNSIPVKGIDYAYASDNVFVHLALGRTYRNDISLIGIDKEQPKFERNIAGLQVGFGDRFGTHFYLTSLKASDIQSAEFEPIDNWVNGIGGMWMPNKKVQVEGEYLHSVYNDNSLFRRREPTTEIVGIEPVKPSSLFWNNSAFSLKGKYLLHKNIELSTARRQFNPGYRSLGAPFLRQNFIEMEYRFKTKLFKRKLRLSGFYKDLRDNSLNIHRVTNKTNGYGFTLHTKIPKWPDLMVSYSPYQQGNNNPDTLYRSNNQFSTLTSSLIYNYSIKQMKGIHISSYTRSEIEYFQLRNQKIATEFVNVANNFIWKKHTLLTNFSHAYTFPGVDTVNFSSVQLTYDYRHSGKATLGGMSRIIQYKNGAYQRSMEIHFRHQMTKKMTANFSLTNGSINNLYGLKQKDFYSGQVSFILRL